MRYIAFAMVEHLMKISGDAGRKFKHVRNRYHDSFDALKIVRSKEAAPTRKIENCHLQPN